MIDIIIIGGGVIGIFIARELSKYKLDILLLEKENDISNGTTKANTGIIHGGYDALEGTNMAKYNVIGNEMFDKVCSELDVPFKRIGSLVIGFNEDDMKNITKLYKRGIENGVKDLHIIDKNELLELEPNINTNVMGALYCKTAGIIGPWELAIALGENAVDNGVNIKLNSEVINIEKLADKYKVMTNESEYVSKVVINCGGVFSDTINNMVNPNSFKINPRRGQYYVLDKECGNLFNHVIFQTPTSLGKGVVVTPTVHGNLLIGPDAEDISNKEDLKTKIDNLEFIKRSALKTSPNIPFNKVITTFSGLRAESNTKDFIIEESLEGFINVAGIKSPGLSASPGIAKYVEDLIVQKFKPEKNNSFNPYRRSNMKLEELSVEERNELIKDNPKYGKIICRCENVSEGEIVDIINRNCGATTIDGVKRRARPGSGRCQGGFCLPRVMEILARELNVDIKDIVKDDVNSYILTKETKSYNEGDKID